MANILQTYWTRVKQFSPNARLFLASIILTGAALGIYRLLFNFYVLSLNMDESVVGQLTSTNSITALILAVPMLSWAVKIVGVAYLLWLAFKLSQSRQLGAADAARLQVGFWQGVALQFVNI